MNIKKTSLKRAQNGFAHIILLLAIVIGVVGFAGWYVMQKNKDDTAKQGKSTPNSTDGKTATPLGPYVAWDYMGGEKWGALSTPPACDEPLAIKSPMDVKQATNVLYPGQVRGGDFKPHGGIGIEGKSDNKVDVSMPLGAYLYRGAKHIEAGEVQYMFDFIHPCGIMIRIGHLLALSPEFAAYAEQLPQGAEGDSRTTKFTTNTAIKQGTLIATEVGFAKTKNVFFDFGVYDLRSTNAAAKDPAFADEPKRKQDKEQSYYALCWLDLLTGSEKTTIKALPARGAEGTVSDYCK